MLRSGSLVSRLTAAALLVLLLLAGYQTMVRPLVELYQDNRRTITRSEDLLERYLQLAAERESLSEHLAALEQDPDRLAHYFDESSDTLAAAAIQDRAAETIASTGGEVK
ncbi:MAG: type II secretion system protein GspM, partial [Geminicoccaceae bacterium]